MFHFLVLFNIECFISSCYSIFISSCYSILNVPFRIFLVVNGPLLNAPFPLIERAILEKTVQDSLAKNDQNWLDTSPYFNIEQESWKFARMKQCLVVSGPSGSGKIYWFRKINLVESVYSIGQVYSKSFPKTLVLVWVVPLINLDTTRSPRPGEVNTFKLGSGTELSLYWKGLVWKDDSR